MIAVLDLDHVLVLGHVLGHVLGLVLVIRILGPGRVRARSPLNSPRMATILRSTVTPPDASADYGKRVRLYARSPR